MVFAVAASKFGDKPTEDFAIGYPKVPSHLQ